MDLFGFADAGLAATQFWKATRPRCNWVLGSRPSCHWVRDETQLSSGGHAARDAGYVVSRNFPATTDWLVRIVLELL